jgi:DNA-binding protein HU-beta
VIKLDIINRVADKTGVPKMKAEQAVEALFHSMKEALTRGERIELRGFGVFVVKPRKRGVGRNPRTGEEVAIPSGKTIRFKPGKELQGSRRRQRRLASNPFTVSRQHNQSSLHKYTVMTTPIGIGACFLLI